MSDTDNPESNHHTEQEPDINQDSAHTTSKEVGGPKGLEPTRYGDWEKNGRCIDF